HVSTLSLHDALPIYANTREQRRQAARFECRRRAGAHGEVALPDRHLRPPGLDLLQAKGDRIGADEDQEVVAIELLHPSAARRVQDRKSTRLNSSHVK